MLLLLSPQRHSSSLRVKHPTLSLASDLEVRGLADSDLVSVGQLLRSSFAPDSNPVSGAACNSLCVRLLHYQSTRAKARQCRPLVCGCKTLSSRMGNCMWPHRAPAIMTAFDSRSPRQVTAGSRQVTLSTTRCFIGAANNYWTTPL